MKKYNPFKYTLVFLMGALLLLSSCEKEPKPEPGSDLPRDIQILNNWIWGGMNDIYLWEAFLPNLDPGFEQDPEKFFYKLLYRDDHDSWIVDDYESLRAMFDGVQRATGMTVQPAYITETQVISVVQYVTPNSPAEDSGIVRGDIIMSINNQTLDGDNYFDLYYETTATFTFGTWDGINMVPTGKEVTLTAVVLNQNPIIHHEIIESQGKKIGYFVYTQFTDGQDDEWLIELNNVFDGFKSAGVTDIVVDLRYNGGGSLDLSAYLASLLGSVSAMENNEIYVNMIWNEKYNQNWKEADLDDDGKPDGSESGQLIIRLPSSDFNLNLSKVYFLTTRGTASASESLMVGLYPYIDVVQIGTTTYGKCYGSVTIDDWESPKRHNWAMQPIVLKFSNADGFTDFLNGIEPDHVVEEYLLELEPFGSTDDPFLAKALQEITGVVPARKKSAAPVMEIRTIPVPRLQIPERFIDWSEMPWTLQENP